MRIDLLNHLYRHLRGTDSLESADPAEVVISNVRDNSYKRETGKVSDF